MASTFASETTTPAKTPKHLQNKVAVKQVAVKQVAVKRKFCMYQLQGICRKTSEECPYAHSMEEMEQSRGKDKKKSAQRDEGDVPVVPRSRPGTQSGALARATRVPSPRKVSPVSRGRGLGLDGHWRSISNETDLTIQGDIVTTKDGACGILKEEGTGNFSMVVDGKACTAQRVGSRLEWEDGDVWMKKEPQAPEVSPEPEMTSEPEVCQDKRGPMEIRVPQGRCGLSLTAVNAGGAAPVGLSWPRPPPGLEAEAAGAAVPAVVSAGQQRRTLPKPKAEPKAPEPWAELKARPFKPSDVQLAYTQQDMTSFTGMMQVRSWWQTPVPDVGADSMLSLVSAIKGAAACVNELADKAEQQRMLPGYEYAGLHHQHPYCHMGMDMGYHGWNAYGLQGA